MHWRFEKRKKGVSYSKYESGIISSSPQSTPSNSPSCFRVFSSIPLFFSTVLTNA